MKLTEFIFPQMLTDGYTRMERHKYVIPNKHLGFF